MELWTWGRLGVASLETNHFHPTSQVAYLGSFPGQTFTNSAGSAGTSRTTLPNPSNVPITSTEN